MIDFLDNLIGFAFALVAVTGAILAIIGCAFVLLLMVGLVWRFGSDAWREFAAYRAKGHS